VALLVAVSEKKAQVAFPGHNGKIAYTEYDSYPDEDREIYTMNPDGTDRKQLTDNSANEFAPDVSPDGKRIAFIAFLGANEGDLYKVKSDGSGEPRVVGGPADSLEFEPD
jgi:Tol biopolymer transport system component